MLQKIVLILIIICSTISCDAQLAKPLPNGHAHNDYEKPWPALTKALEEGFVSVEIDVFPIKDKLKVAHIGLFAGLGPELEDLYFKPLEAWLKEHGQLFSDPEQRLTFMIDIKQGAPKTYTMLRVLCEKYKHLITCRYPLQDSIHYGKIDLLLSGHKPYNQVMADSVRYMLIDGGLGEINHATRTKEIAPRISTRYGSLFNWRGVGEIPANERQKLRAIVKKAHADGRKVRFWAMPNKAAVWQVMLDEGVDWMNVDELEEFRLFYESYLLK
jgi:hypothetical protein